MKPTLFVGQLGAGGRSGYPCGAARQQRCEHGRKVGGMSGSIAVLHDGPRRLKAREAAHLHATRTAPKKQAPLRTVAIIEGGRYALPTRGLGQATGGALISQACGVAWVFLPAPR